jgi:WD40 repeat protein
MKYYIAIVFVFAGTINLGWLHSMNNSRTLPVQRERTAAELAQFAKEQKTQSNNTHESDRASDNREMQASVQVSTHSVQAKSNKTNQHNFVKTIMYFNKLPKQLQKYIHGFNQKLTLLKNIPINYVGVDALAVYQDDTGWKVIFNKGQVLHIWDIATGKEIITLSGHTKATVVRIVPYKDNTGWKAMSFAKGDKNLIVWDLTTGKILQMLRVREDSWIFCLVACQDNKGWKAIAINDSDQHLRVWDLATGKQLHDLNDHLDDAHCIDTYHDDTGSKIISAYADHSICVWDLDTGKLLHTFEGYSDTDKYIAIHKEHNNFKVICTTENGTLKVWDLATRRLVYTFEKTVTGFGSNITIHHNGINRVVISVSDFNNLKIWDLSTGRLLENFNFNGPIKYVDKIVAYQDNSGLKILGTSHEFLHILGYATGDCEAIQEELENQKKAAPKKEDAGNTNTSWCTIS